MPAAAQIAEAAALGLRARTGWAAVVALADARPLPRLMLRRRIDLQDPSGRVPRFVYHAAAEAGAKRGAALVEIARAAATLAAGKAVDAAVGELRRAGLSVHAAAILTGTASLPDDLEKILAVHALVHAAEGVLYRQALVEACRDRGLVVLAIPERELWRRAQQALGGDEAAIQAAVRDLGMPAGPPWGGDRKTAAAGAWTALATTA
jgi:hypothetical protein